VTDTATIYAEFADIFRTDNADPAFIDLITPGLQSTSGDGYVLEIGAGTGFETMQIAAALPASQLYAIEQSPAMRSALNSKLAAAPDVLARTTVIAADFFRAILPAQWSCVIAHHFICQIDPSHRAIFWQLIRQHLAANGAAFVDRHYGAISLSTVNLRLSAQATAGENRYERWYAAELLDSGLVSVTVTYKTYRSGQFITSQSSSTTMQFVQEEEILNEITSAGLKCDVNENFLRLSHA